MKRNFEDFLATLEPSIRTYRYYVNFDKVYDNIEKIKVELNILNSLVGSKNIEHDFRSIVEKYPETLKCIPLLLAVREKELLVNDGTRKLTINFKKMNYSVGEYVRFMQETGLFELMSSHLVSNLVDYVSGVEVGSNTNGRKNRTGDAMEDIVESFISSVGFEKDKNYFKEMKTSDIKDKWNMDLSGLSDKTEKQFDFVVKTDSMIYGVEVNFYHNQGSKLNETARSYKQLALNSKGISGFKFVWVTDGVGWNRALNNLRETYAVLDDVYNIYDLRNGILKKLLV